MVCAIPEQGSPAVVCGHCSYIWTPTTDVQKVTCPSCTYKTDNVPTREESIIRAKWVMDGSTTLKEAAETLRAFATHLEEGSDDGWELKGEVSDDYGFIHRPLKD